MKYVLVRNLIITFFISLLIIPLKNVSAEDLFIDDFSTGKDKDIFVDFYDFKSDKPVSQPLKDGFLVKEKGTFAVAEFESHRPVYGVDNFMRKKRYMTAELGRERLSVYILSCVVPEMKMGSRGNWVRYLQSYLSQYGNKKINGVYDKATETAVMKLQKKNKLKQTGIVDKKTASFLNAVIQKAYTVPCRITTAAGMRDEKRVKDLGAIQEALSSYAADAGGYPVGDRVILGQDNAKVLSGDFGLANNGAGKIYLDGIPSNPLPGGSDYVYTSYIEGYSDEKCTAAPCGSYTIQFKLDGPILEYPYTFHPETTNDSVKNKFTPGGSNIMAPFDQIL